MKKFKLKSLYQKLLLVTLFTIIAYISYGEYHIESDYASYINYAYLAIALSLSFVLPKWFDVVYLNFWMILLNVGLWMQTVYFRAFLQYGRISVLISQKTEAIQSWDSIKEFISIKDLQYLIYIILFLTTSILITKFSNKAKNKLYLIYGLISVSFIGIASFNIYEFYQKLEESRHEESVFTYYKTDHYEYSIRLSTAPFVQKFGLTGLFHKDIVDFYITPFFSNATEENSEITNILSNKIYSENTDYTGLLAGKSLLLIEAESLMHLAIDPELTPTLYKLRLEGLNFSSYNSPLLTGSTSDTEFMVNTSLLPANEGFNTFMSYAENTYPVTIADYFNNSGYSVLAAHNNYAEFYNRNNMLPALGYKFWDAIDMGFQNQMVPDSEFLVPIKWISYEKEKFFSFWITFNGHQPYSLDEMNSLFYPYYEQVSTKYPDLPEAEKVYLAKTMDFDKGLASLIQDYTYSGKIDDLVIAIYGDHFVKGAFSDPSIVDMVCTDTVDKCTYTPFIIWSNSIEHENIDKVSNPLDILPTILDLYGIDYNQNFTLGHSIFDDTYEGFYFNAWGGITVGDEVYDTSVENPSIPSDKILEAMNLLDVGPKIVENDYFASEECTASFGEACIK